MGIRDTVGAVIQSFNPKKWYEMGFDDGKSGKPRYYFNPNTDVMKDQKEAYNQGYDDGVRSRIGY